MSPGIYKMSAEEYHRLPYLSHSLAKVMIAQSPLHAWTECAALNPNYEPEEKEAFDIGQATHALLFEGEDRMVVVDAPDWRTKDARTARDEARKAGKHPILAARYPDVLKMRDAAVLAITQCGQLSGLTLTNGRAEHVLIWEEQGVMCRARPDFLAGGERVALDYKTTTDATPGAFSRQIARMGYHIQDEFYSRGIQALFGHRPKFIFVAQETRAPHSCSFHGCGPSLQAVAAQDVDYAVRTWRECLASNHWPGHDQRIHWAEAMPWQLDETEDRAARGIPYEPGQLYKGAFAKETDPA